MMSVEVLAGSPSAVARSEDFIFFDFLCVLESLSLPILLSRKLRWMECAEILCTRFSRSTMGLGDAT